MPALLDQGNALSDRARGLEELDALEAVFAERFSHTWSTTTRHLQKLEQAGLVSVEKAGRERRYSIDLDRLRSTTSLFLDVFGEA